MREKKKVNTEKNIDPYASEKKENLSFFSKKQLRKLREKYSEDELFDYYVWECPKCKWIGLARDAEPGTVNGQDWTESAGGYWYDTYTDPWCPCGCKGTLDRVNGWAR